MTQQMDPNELTAPDTWDLEEIRSILVTDQNGKPLFYNPRARVRRFSDGSLEIIGIDPMEK